MTYSPVSSYGLEDSLIDPLLAYPCYQSNYEDAQMRRFLQEPQSAIFNPPGPCSTQSAHLSPARAEIIDQSALDPQTRSASSLSQHQSSFSGGQSDLAESDLYQTNSQGPTTPRDMAILSPYFKEVPYESLDQDSLAGMTSGYVNPCDINPVYDSQIEYPLGKDDASDFSLGGGTFYDQPFSSQYPEGFTDRHNVPSSHHDQSGVLGIHITSPVESTYPDPESVEGDFGRAEQATVTTPPLTHPEEDDRVALQENGSRNIKNITKRMRPYKRPSTLTENAGVTKTVVPITSVAPRNKPHPSAMTPKRCDKCSLSFADDKALQKHDTDSHKRYFICVFHFAGCDKLFKSKNEWKRHAASQHLNLRYWLCATDDCGQLKAEGCGSVDSPLFGRPFRRKDLFTQHLRRMHLAIPPSGHGRTSKAALAKYDPVREKQDAAERQRCALPTYMKCPLPSCPVEFRGDKAWNERMEHVAGHLEAAGSGSGPPVEFGGEHDETLTSWASDEAVGVICRTANGWELCEPLKGGKDDVSVMSVGNTSSDQDAEGEDCD